jgi:hypothetical protein
MIWKVTNTVYMGKNIQTYDGNFLNTYGALYFTKRSWFTVSALLPVVIEWLEAWRGVVMSAGRPRVSGSNVQLPVRQFPPSCRLTPSDQINPCFVGKQFVNGDMFITATVWWVLLLVSLFLLYCIIAIILNILLSDIEGPGGIDPIAA